MNQNQLIFSSPTEYLGNSILSVQTQILSTKDMNDPKSKTLITVSLKVTVKKPGMSLNTKYINCSYDYVGRILRDKGGWPIENFINLDAALKVIDTQIAAFVK